MTNRKATILLTLLLLSTAAPKIRGQGSENPPDAAKPFRSELWQLEYRQEDEQQDGSQTTDAKEQNGEQAVPLEKRKSPVATDSVTNPLISGEKELEQLQQETVIDKWQLDASLANEDEKGAFRHEATAWQLSRAHSPNGNVTATMNQGPTLTTFLVGIVACIVMTGAIFSGRE